MNENLLSDVVNNMPDVSPVADSIAQKISDQKAEENQNAAQIHTEKPKRGRPRKNSDQPGQSSKNNAGSRLGGVADARERANAEKVAADLEQRRAAAHIVVNMMEVSGTALAGDDAKMHEVERAGLEGTWSAYFDVKGIDIPPGFALALVCMQYYGRVLSAPVALPKVQSLLFKIKMRFKGFKKNARSNRRDDSKRKNDTGETVIEAIPGEGN